MVWNPGRYIKISVKLYSNTSWTAESNKIWLTASNECYQFDEQKRVYVLQIGIFQMTMTGTL